MRYSKGFERDFAFYFRMRKEFWFSGKEDKKVIFNKDGVDAKEGFLNFENGTSMPTRHPLLLQSLIKAKGSCNFHIKMYAEDRKSGLICGLELQEILNEINPPDWFKVAIEKQMI